VIQIGLTGDWLIGNMNF